MNTLVRKICCSIVLLTVFFTVKAQQFPAIAATKNLTYKIIPATGKTWGYDIYNNNKLFVHQPTVPALPGNQGFATKTAAEKVAKKVIEKIGKGESPPTVSVDEMKQLGAIPKQ